MEAVAAADASNKIAKLKGDFAAVWPRVHTGGRDRFQREIITGRFGEEVLQPGYLTLSESLCVVSLSASSE